MGERFCTCNAPPERAVGDPLLDDPIVRQEIQKSKQDMKEQSSKTHKSLFTGPFGGHVFGTPGSYGTARRGRERTELALREWRRRQETIGFRHLAIGGPVGLMDDIGLPQVSGSSSIVGGGGTSEALHHVTIDLGGGREINGLRAPDDVVRSITSAARDSANVRTGQMPGWYRGR